MPAYEVQMTIFPVSNLAADAATNTWSVDADDDTAAETFETFLEDFYDTMAPYFSDRVRQNDHVYKIYDRADPTPRQPIAEGTFNLSSAPSGAGMPPEVALCLSFEGLPTSGIPQARRRGRVYIGPLDTTTGGSGGAPSSAFVTALANAGDTLLTASNAAATWTWCVWSTVNSANVPIARGWVDAAFDTQRRRGVAPASRTVFP